jgi:hypothetical protein
MTRLRPVIALGLAWCLLPPATRPAAQQPAREVVEAEREEFAAWLRTAPLSPRRAVAVLVIGPGLSVGGREADIAIPDLPPHRIEERDGRLTLTGPSGSRPLRRGIPFALGEHRLVAGGPVGRATITVFAPGLRPGKDPLWFPYDPRHSQLVELTAPAEPAARRILAPDGVEVEATEAGTVTVTIGGRAYRLRVMRLPGDSDDETELEIYFRDATGDRETYPAGRFVALVPEAGRYRLDFNRARNPYCAYNTVYPCPAPWRGNLIAAAVRAGERYAGGGLEPPPD